MMSAKLFGGSNNPYSIGSSVLIFETSWEAFL